MVVKLSGIIARIIFAVKEFFSGGWARRDIAAFEDFYHRIRGNILHLEADFLKGENLSMALPELKSLLKCAAKISNSSWGRTLKKQSSEFQIFRDRLHHLQNIADPFLDQTSRSVQRYIRATDPQREFAAYLDLEEVPFRFDEIPAGAVLITDPHAYLLHFKLTEKKTIWMAVVLKTKAFICQFFTGIRFTHAELSLGHGDSFDLVKMQGMWVSAKGLIQHRLDKIFYGSFVVPRKEAMLEAYHQRFPDRPKITFEELFAQISAEAIAGAPLIHAGFFDIMKTGLKPARPIDYDCTQAWQPGIKQYGCSASVSALYSKFGIDIGKEFSKMDQNVTPVDFLRSRFFTPAYVT